jgi:hypothetical protein
MNRNPTPRHGEQILLRSNPVAQQEAHSSQSTAFVALWFIPRQRSPPMVLLQRPSATVALYPAVPHSVQQVFGSSLFRARRYLLADRGLLFLSGRWHQAYCAPLPKKHPFDAAAFHFGTTIPH